MKFLILSLAFILEVSVLLTEGRKPNQFQPEPRIVGGRSAKIQSFPYQVAIRSNNFLCGGSIVSKNYILTAAHCVYNLRTNKLLSASSFLIRAGSSQRSRGGEVYRVEKIIPHPKHRKFDYDIALLKLQKPLNFSDKIKAIELASQDPPTNSFVNVTGWGTTSSFGYIPETLQYTSLKVMRQRDCDLMYGYSSKNLLCLAHAYNNGVCYGDSGGPAVYNQRLVGVSNFVVNGCASNLPDAFARITIYRSWIKENSDVK